MIPRLPTDFLFAAGSFFERERGVPLDFHDEEIIRNAGIQFATADELAERLWAALEEGLSEDCRSTAYWALGKRCRKEAKGKWVAALKIEVRRSASAVYQIMIALDNIGESVFSPDRSGYSMNEEAQNLADAEQYLAANVGISDAHES
jgi:hypothetical protein